mmetsp:Transcript_1175/g.1248  ORF Transcript_1175/g.1248 Transcript_1175/m.1248 type:complete len:84 (+) Transcript_1175:2879-3130(+)
MTVNFSSFDIQENQNGRITKDNIVWITGASSGIGESMAVQVANEGGKVILSTNRIESKLQNSEDHFRRKPTATFYNLPTLVQL